MRCGEDLAVSGRSASHPLHNLASEVTSEALIKVAQPLNFSSHWPTFKDWISKNVHEKKNHFVFPVYYLSNISMHFI